MSQALPPKIAELPSGKDAPETPIESIPGIVNNMIEPMIVFKIQDIVFGLPRSQVMQSGFFRGMLESPHLGDSKEGTLEKPITFDERTGITPEDMKYFCSVLDIRAFQQPPKLAPAQWASAYRLAKMWEFEQLRDYIFKFLDKSVKDPFERIEFADMLGVETWIIPALAEICRRDKTLTVEEGTRLGFTRLLQVCKQRERGRSQYEISDYETWLGKSEE
ncbi:hypothetical protein FRC04_004849 [Tulasnella sp. 424]|nr:hypothetical protein FRC04_004849 [Tulasnella sp. 424]KAG8963592.1 hypothetical protein FRC05_004601 [Tulasnella sp. 425]